MRKTPIFCTALILAVIAFIHLWRLIHPFPILIDDVEVPLWASAVAFIFLGLLTGWLLSALYPGNNKAKK